MSSSSSKSSFDMCSDGSVDSDDSIIYGLDDLDALSINTQCPSPSVLVMDQIEKLKDKQEEISEKLDSVTKTNEKIDEKLEMLLAMVKTLTEEIKEIKEEKVVEKEKEAEEKTAEEMYKLVAELNKLPITETINGEWEQVKSTNLDAYIAGLNCSKEQEMKWRAGNLCFNVIGNDLYSTHRVYGVPHVKAARTTLLEGYQKDHEFLYQSYVENNKLVTVHHSETHGRVTLRIERSVSNGLLTTVYKRGAVTCTRIFKRVGDFKDI